MATIERRIANAATRAAIAWSNGDDDQAEYWQAQAVLLMDERDAMHTQPTVERGGFHCAPVSFYARPANA